MTVVTNVLSVNNTILDQVGAPPATGFLGITSLTGGEGIGGAFQRRVVDQLPLTTAFTGATANWGRVARFPANAKIQSIVVSSDVIVDSNSTQTLALSFSVGYSDSVNDGTPQYLQGLQPPNTVYATVLTDVAAGTNVAAVANTAATRNKLFGTVTMSGNNLILAPTQLIYPAIPLEIGIAASGVVAGTCAVPIFTLLTTPVSALFATLSGQGYQQDNLGWMDLIVYVEAVAATPVTGNLNVVLDYIV